jgi:hypothetical protein
MLVAELHVRLRSYAVRVCRPTLAARQFFGKQAPRAGDDAASPGGCRPPTLDIAAICLAATALLAYLNHRFAGLPTTIGVMAIALVVSLAIVALDALGVTGALSAAAAQDLPRPAMGPPMDGPQYRVRPTPTHRTSA